MMLAVPDASEPSSEAAHAAVTRLAEEHGPLLFQLGYRFCGDPHQAEDLVQEVFMAALKGWDGFRGASDEKTWLYRIAARACERLHRRRAGEPEHIGSLDVTLPFGDDRMPAVPEEGDPAKAVLQAESRERIERAIVALPDEFRVPLVLKDIAGFSVVEIAGVLGLEEGTVRSRVHRARMKLRDAMERGLPRDPRPAPPPAYPLQTCLDLLEAKQSALDRGVPFESTVICDRCRAVFGTLDMAHAICGDLGRDGMPGEVRARLLAAIREQARSESEQKI
jgi:RNA polymerase sigma-70 factor (ECF subfamily)